MNRRFFVSFLTFAISSLVVNLDAPNAEAQLFRRLRARIQSRLQPLPPQPPQSPNAPNRAAPNQTGPTAAKPQRVPPVAPATNRPKSEPGAVTPRSTSTQPSDRSDENEFGGSILKFNADPPTTAKEPDVSGRPTLGVEVYPSRGQVRGVEVVRFRDESRADEAGLKIGDVIVALDGNRTPDVAAVSKQLVGKRFGQSINARVVRGTGTLYISIPLVAKQNVVAKPRVQAQPEAIQLTPAPLPDGVAESKARGPLGIQVRDADGVRGAVIATVQPRSPAAAAGLKVGDRIVAINGALVTNSESMAGELAKLAATEPLSLRLVRDQKLVSAEVPLSSDAVATDATDGKGGGSALDGIGSVLGGFFGGNESTPPSPDKKDSPVRQVGFDEEQKGADPAKRQRETNDRPLVDDPPSLDELELPPESVEPVDASTDAETPEQQAKRLREEIRQLEERLEELKAKKQSEE